MATLILNRHHSCVSIPLLGFAFSAVTILIHRLIVHMVCFTCFSLWSHEIFVQTCLFQSVPISAFNIILGIFLKALDVCIWSNLNVLNYLENNRFWISISVPATPAQRGTGELSLVIWFPSALFDNLSFSPDQLAYIHKDP